MTNQRNIETYYKRKNDMRDYIWTRLGEYIQFVSVDKFTEEEPEELLNNFFNFCKNRVKIDIRNKDFIS